jgi:hypothetical protein
VDGHISHYSYEFILLTCKLRIQIFCYPAHVTHVYQGLNVVIFSPLKGYWMEEKNEFERTTRQKMDKTNFLKIYGRAHVRVLSKGNIKARFRKTGLWPINQAVITPAMMAPSFETAMRGNLPVAPSTPVCVAIDTMHEIHQQAKRPCSPESDNEGIAPGHQGSLASYLDNSFQMVCSSSAAFLVSSSPIQALIRYSRIFSQNLPYMYFSHIIRP